MLQILQNCFYEYFHIIIGITYVQLFISFSNSIV